MIRAHLADIATFYWHAAYYSATSILITINLARIFLVSDLVSYSGGFKLKN